MAIEVPFTSPYGIEVTNLTQPIPILYGGTGKETRQDAINALTGTQVANTVLRSDGTNVTLSSVNISTDITGTLAIANGGTGATDAATARTNLGLVIGTDIQGYSATLAFWASKTVPTGDIVGTTDIQTLTNKTIDGASNTLSNIGNSSLSNSSITINGSNISLGGTVSVGTVTSVEISGGTTGLTATGGPITSSGTLTLSGTLAIANGGTGATTAAGAITNLLPSQTGNESKVLSTDGSGNLSWVEMTAGSESYTLPTASTTVLGGVKVDGTTISIDENGVISSSAVGSGTVTSVDISGGTTGLTVTGGPITSSGTITLGGTLAVANGGTGLTTYTSGDLLYASNSTTLSKLGIGTSGQVLTVSNGSLSWSDGYSLPTQTGNSGKYLTTNGITASWGIAGSDGQLLFNSSYAVSGTSRITYNGTDTLTVGVPGTTFNIAASTGAGITAPANLQILGGNAAGGANGTDPGTVTIQGGTASRLYAAGGNVIIKGGDSQLLPGALGQVAIQNNFWVTANGSLSFGTPSGYGTQGQVLTSNGPNHPTWTTIESYSLPTASTTVLGGVKVDGTSITINGDGVISAPTSGSGTVTSVDISGGTTGLTVTGGPITSSGTITLDGTLAIANGGTGATTAGDAINALLPSQTGNANKFLSTNGSGTLSWEEETIYTLPTASTTVLGGVKVDGTSITITDGVISGASTYSLPTASTTVLGGVKVDGTSITITDGVVSSVATGSVTSVDISGGTTGLTVTGGPITSSGTLTLDGTLAIANGGTGATDAAAARTNLGLVIGTDVQAYNETLTTWAGKTVPTGDVIGTTDTQTLTNKTIDGANNTLSNIGNNSLVNSDITINGTNVSLGGTVSVGTVTSVDISGGTTGLTVTGGPITESGTLTLDGTLAIANGGTGATTAGDAINNLLPSQTGNTNKVLSTDGSGNLVWVAMASNNELDFGTFDAPSGITFDLGSF